MSQSGELLKHKKRSWNKEEETTTVCPPTPSVCSPCDRFLSSAEKGGGWASRKADRGEVPLGTGPVRVGRGRGKSGVSVFTVGSKGTSGLQIVSRKNW